MVAFSCRGSGKLKAVRFHEFGGPEKLRYEDAPDPMIVENDALV